VTNSMHGLVSGVAGCPELQWIHSIQPGPDQDAVCHSCLLQLQETVDHLVWRWSSTKIQTSPCPWWNPIFCRTLLVADECGRKCSWARVSFWADELGNSSCSHRKLEFYRHSTLPKH
jgi:hypothetical protein